MTDPHHRPQEASAGGWSRLDTVLLVAIVLGAAVLRFASLGRPVELVFDEIFYARDACWYVIGTQDVCGITDLASRAHPPLGKWLIGSGIALFGYDPFGWRVASAVIGTATVALVYPLGRRLLRLDHDPDRRHRRSGGRGRAAGDRLPAPRPLAHRDARLVHHVLRRRRGVRRRPRSGPSTRADRCAVVVAPHPRSPVAAGGGHLPRRGGGREVVGGLRRAGGHRPRRGVGDRRAEAGRAGRRMGVRGSAARSGARRCRRSSCWGSCRCSSTSPATPGGCRASWLRCRGSRDRSGAASGSTSARCSTSTPRCRATTPTSRRRGRGR